MSLSTTLFFPDRTITLHWQGGTPADLSPDIPLTQASAVAFTSEGNIVLIANEAGKWTLPGGTVEQGETIAETLRRELWEEACAEVTEEVYLGAVLVEDPANPAGLPRYYQTRFWARVVLRPFIPQFETVGRCEVIPSTFVATINWQTKDFAQLLLTEALRQETNHPLGRAS